MDESTSILAYLGLSGLIKLTLCYMWKDRKPKNLEKAGRVTGLCLYPVKSTKAINLKQIQCSSEKAAHSGPIIDRQWMVVTDGGEVVSARQEPRLLGLETSFDGGKLVITTPDKESVTVDPETVEKSDKVISGSFCGMTLTGVDCGEGAAQFLNRYLNKTGHHLVYCSPRTHTRKVLGAYAPLIYWTSQAKEEDVLSFQDTISVHLEVEESLADLNTRLDKPVTYRNFRPNIVISSGLAPYSEDNWSDVFIGEVRFKALKLCDRCVLPTIDPDSFVKDKDYQPTKTLKSYRSFVDGLAPYMGIDLVVQRPGTIKVGDPVYITRGDYLWK